MKEQLWGSDFNDVDTLRKIAAATPDNYVVVDPNDDRFMIRPGMDEILPLVMDAQRKLAELGEPLQKPRPAPQLPAEPGARIDALLGQAAQRMCKRIR